MHEEGILDNPHALTLGSKQTEILRAVRRTGGTVIFVNEEHRRNPRGRSWFCSTHEACARGIMGSEVVESLVVEKMILQ